MRKVTNCNALLIILIEKAQASNNITFIMLLTRIIHAQKKHSPARELTLSPAPLPVAKKATTKPQLSNSWKARSAV